ncbi:hypothetical protein [Mesorhizobium sp. M1A.F.Ca.ET.072.01.1.1]|nr:hypothetical protein [Mesorhizobium sp. M1A.F.Ca.ET.072.01.1.1]
MIALGSRLADPEAAFAAGLAVFAVAALAADVGFVFFAAAAGFAVVFGLEPAFAGDGVLAGEAVLEDEALGAPASTGAALALAFAGGVVFAAFATKSLPGVLVLLLRRISFRFRKRSSRCGRLRIPRNPAWHLCIASIGGRASLAPAAAAERFAAEILSLDASRRRVPTRTWDRRQELLVSFRQSLNQ